jgi:hypothetical protein
VCAPGAAVLKIPAFANLDWPKPNLIDSPLYRAARDDPCSVLMGEGVPELSVEAASFGDAVDGDVGARVAR